MICSTISRHYCFFGVANKHLLTGQEIELKRARNHDEQFNQLHKKHAGTKSVNENKNQKGFFIIRMIVYFLGSILYL